MALTSGSTQVILICFWFAFFSANHFAVSSWLSRESVRGARSQSKLALIPSKSICLWNATLFALVCGYGGCYVWLFPSEEQVRSPLHGHNVLQEWLCLAAVGYFAYDLLVVLCIDYSHLYLLHAVLGATFAYLGGVVPLASYAGAFVMAFEVSTPFKNVRYVLLKMGYSKTLRFRVCELCFVISFLCLRLCVGLPAMWKVSVLLLRELEVQQNGEGVAVAGGRLHYYGTVFLLVGGWLNAALNLYWAWAIFKAVAVFSSSTRHRTHYTPADEGEIIAETGGGALDEGAGAGGGGCESDCGEERSKAGVSTSSSASASGGVCEWLCNHQGSSRSETSINTSTKSLLVPRSRKQ